MFVSCFTDDITHTVFVFYIFQKFFPSLVKYFSSGPVVAMVWCELDIALHIIFKVWVDLFSLSSQLCFCLNMHHLYLVLYLQGR